MPPLSRRALLGTLATGSLSVTSGCQALTNDQPTVGPPAVTGLTSRTVFLDDQIDLPPTVDVDVTGTPTDADLAVFRPGAASVESAVETLAADVPIAIVGPDAEGTLLDSCRAADRPYGIARNSRDDTTGVVGAVPAFGTLDTHLFVGAELPRDLPWALGQLLEPATPECAVPPEHVPLPERAVSLGTARIRGYNAVGEFDRRDRVAVAPEQTPTSVFVDTEATIVAGRRGGDTGPYQVDQVTLAALFDQSFDAVGPAGQTTAGLAVQNRSDPLEHEARVEFTPRTAQRRASVTVCQRARLVVESFSGPFSYTGNARFRWTDPQLLEDETWVQHTPGRARWYPREQ